MIQKGYPSTISKGYLSGITVNAPHASAAFTIDAQGLIVTLTDTSTNEVFRSVDWGDGTINNLLTHTYSAFNTYTITLTVNNNSSISHDVTLNSTEGADFVGHLVNQSTALTDKIATGDVLSAPNTQWTIAFWYKPHHNPTNSDNNEVIEWANAGATSRIMFQWDATGMEYQSWFQVDGGNYRQARYTYTFTPGTWYHLMGRYGLDLPGNIVFAGLDAVVNGLVTDNVVCPAPTPGNATSITLWQDRFTQNSPKGSLARFAAWKDIALCHSEANYLSHGGNPLSIRPSQRATALVEYLDLDGTPADSGPNALTQIVTGTTNLAGDKIGNIRLLPEAQSMGRSGNIYMVCHRGGYTPTNSSIYVMFLAECIDGSGINFNFRPCYQVSPASKIFRDGDVIYDPTTAKWWAGCINEGTNGVSSTWDLFSSLDANEWTFVLSVNCSSITGTGSGKRTWKPRWFIDDDASVHVIVGLASTGQPYLYEMHPTNAAFTTWSAPTIITGTALPATIYDAQWIKQGSTYYLIYTNWSGYPAGTPTYIEIMSSSALTSGYTVIKTADWAGWGNNVQGPCIIQRPDSYWLIYIDRGGNNMLYSKSTKTGDLATVLASASWTALIPINFCGLPNQEPYFVAEGATIRAI